MFRSLVRSIAVVGIALAGIWLSMPNASAQRYDKKTTMTVNQPFEIPGVALPAGKYVMKLVDVAGSRTIVRFMNADEDTIYATLLGIPDYKLTTPEKSEFSFYEAKPGTPRQLRSWFYPGDNYGIEFVYPKAKAMEIATTSGEHVIAVAELPAQPEEAVSELEEEPIFAITPSGDEAKIEEVHPLEPTVTATTPAPLPELPRTATPFALIGLTGLLAGGMATGLRFIRRR